MMLFVPSGTSPQLSCGETSLPPLPTNSAVDSRGSRWPSCEVVAGEGEVYAAVDAVEWITGRLCSHLSSPSRTSDKCNEKRNT